MLRPQRPSTHRAPLWAALLALSPLSACSCGDDGPGSGDAATDGGAGDGGPTGDGGDPVIGCANPPIAPPPSGTCTLTPGTNGALLLRGDVVAESGLLENGHVLVSDRGTVACAACDCSGEPDFAGASVLACVGVISPALINAHDHITFTETAPTPPSNPDTRYDHRHDWRTGRAGHERIRSVSNQGGDHGIWWGELRNVMAGATTINGSGGAAGLLRNIDQSEPLQEGLGQARVRYSTFPLGDQDGSTLADGCGYERLDRPTDSNIEGAVAYTPHIAEGIARDARNEFLCLSGLAEGASDVIMEKTGVIHGIGLVPGDYAVMAADGASLIWSPRSNIDLYGHTAQVTTAASVGVQIALGSDWTASGSMNILRELRCALELNERNFGGFFSDAALVAMATKNGAAALGSSARIGSLAPGREADLTVWSARERRGYRAILEAEPADVALVLRSGRVLHGDAVIVEGLPGGDMGCETIDVCGAEKRICSERETSFPIAAHRAQVPSNAYDLFFCGDPPGEPTCVPFRVGEFMGVPMPGEADGDGIADALDNCPGVFNAVRPIDGAAQADADGDMIGDACDACPLAPGTSGCERPDPNDVDGDRVSNVEDNCPGVANPMQEDRDGDRTGDACDACPDEANPSGAACTASIYAVKQGLATGRARIVNALVTGVSPAGYFVQVAPGDPAYDPVLGERYSGLFVFTGSAGPFPARGDRVDVDGSAGEFFGQRQLSGSSFTVLSSGQALPPPIEVSSGDATTGGLRAAELESVLIVVRGVSVTDVMPEPGPGDTPPTNEFVVTGGLRVNDYMFLVAPFPEIGERFDFIQGVLRLANGNTKIEPRDLADLGAPARLLRFVPEDAFVAAGTNGVPPGGLAVRLTRPAEADIRVALASSAAELLVPAEVTVRSGDTTADVPIMAPAPRAAPVIVTASYAGDTIEARVTVYDDAAPRAITDLSLSPSLIARMGVASGSVEIDFPGAAGGTSISLAVAPAPLASVPPAVVVPAGAFSAVFTLTAGTSTGAGSLVATTGTSTRTLSFEVTRSILRTPGPGDLLITEVHRNPSGNDEKVREWFEVHNPTADRIEIDRLEVADNFASHTLSAPGAVLEPGAHAVIAYSADPAENGGVNAVAAYGAADLSFANADDEITLRFLGQVIDRVDWGAGWPGAANGIAMCLRAPYPADNDVPSAWSSSVGTFGTAGERGHPGVPSDAQNCP